MRTTTSTPEPDLTADTAQRSRRVVAAVLLAAVLPLSACAGDETVDPGPAPAPAEPTETSDPGGSQSPDGGEAETEDPAATPSDDALPSDSAST